MVRWSNLLHLSSHRTSASMDMAMDEPVPLAVSPVFSLARAIHPIPMLFNMASASGLEHQCSPLVVPAATLSFLFHQQLCACYSWVLLWYPRQPASVAPDQWMILFCVEGAAHQPCAHWFHSVPASSSNGPRTEPLSPRQATRTQ